MHKVHSGMFRARDETAQIQTSGTVIWRELCSGRYPWNAGRATVVEGCGLLSFLKQVNRSMLGGSSLNEAMDNSDEVHCGPRLPS